MKRIVALGFALMLALAPAVAGARPGLGSSMGSRGSMTWSAPRSTNLAPFGASPFTRSATPNYGSGYSSYSRPYGYGGYGYNRSPFMSGLMGGLLGAGIGGLLFGHGFFGFHGGMGFLGLLLQLFLLYLLARWVMRSLFGAAVPAGVSGMARQAFQAPGRAGFGFGGGATRQPISLTGQDYQAFEQTLRNVQAAWSAQDIPALQRFATPEMAGYFGEQLAELASRGQRNMVSDVRLQQGDLSEAWQEGNRQYATVAMRFSMIDVTRDIAGHIVDGSPTERVTATEFWTFVRAPGGAWILSAIQQAR